MILRRVIVSVLFNEPKLLKFDDAFRLASALSGFSALQRAEIAEINVTVLISLDNAKCVSVLFNEPKLLKSVL